jgi:hypothetical protein
MRPREPGDPKSMYREFPNLPVATAPFEFLATELAAPAERPPLAGDDLRAYVTEQISYSVVSRDTVLVVFGGFFLLLIAAAVVLGRRGRLEHLGWIGPALALGAAATFVGLGDRSRGAVPPTVALAQVVDALSGLDEAQAAGYLAVYEPAQDQTSVGAEAGGELDLDLTGLEGRVHRRVQTDLDRWHWENLELPAGVRVASFRYTVRTKEPVEAKIRFGPEGAEGRVASGPFAPLEDALLCTPGRLTAAVRLGADGAFRSLPGDESYAGPMIAAGLLSDRQRGRQALYEKVLAEPRPRYLADRSLLLAWAEPVDMNFSLAPEARRTGSALVTIPLRFERTPPGTPVTVPAAFVDCRRVTSDGRAVRVATESPLATSMRLRFRLPASVLPMAVERCRLMLRVYAPLREVALSGFAGGQTVPVRRWESPLGVAQVEIDDPRLLRPDVQGVLEFGVEVGTLRGGSAGQDQWRLDSAGLEIRGRTSDGGRAEHESR